MIWLVLTTVLVALWLAIYAWLASRVLHAAIVALRAAQAEVAKYREAQEETVRQTLAVSAKIELMDRALSAWLAAHWTQPPETPLTPAEKLAAAKAKYGIN